MPRRDGATWRATGAAAVVVALAGVLLAVLVVAGWAAAPTDDLDGGDEQFAQLVCVQRQLEQRVPAGARVQVAERDVMAADPLLDDVQASYWFQRLTELAYPRVELVADPSAATYVVAVSSEAPAGCRGLGVVAREAP